MIQSFAKPQDVEEALRLKKGDPNSVWLSGGTFLLTGAFRDTPMNAIAIDGIVPKDIAKEGHVLSIGANATFQDLLDFNDIPDVIRKAALGMTNRIVRNRATVGGNIGANKSCSSLVPVFIALDAEYELADGRQVRADDYAEDMKDLIMKVIIKNRTGFHAAYKRWARVSCDLSVITAIVSAKPSDGTLSDIRVACGGMSKHSIRFQSIETLFEGKKLPPREERDAMIEPLFAPIDDHRASAAFKRFRAARMVSDCLFECLEAENQGGKA